MNAQLECRHRFDTRLWMFGIFAIVLLLALLVRLVDLQWFRHDTFKLQAEQNFISILPSLPVRGEIHDRNGKDLAINAVSYELTLIPNRAGKIQQTLSRLGQHMGWNQEQKSRLFKKTKRSRSDRPVILQDQLKWEDIASIAANLHHFPGVNIEPATHRVYPYKDITSHLVGYISQANEDDVAHGRLSQEKVGRSGVEKEFEPLLHGKLGYLQEEVDAMGHRVGLQQKEAPHIGESIRLSIDVDMQSIASDALGNRAGAVVVMDPRNGELLTLLSKPGIDNNFFITGLDHAQWSQWLEDPHHPLIDRSIQSAYPPASTFKLLTVLAGLEHNIPLSHQGVTCEGSLEVGDRHLSCWKKEGHGYVNVLSAIEQSCDVYFYYLADQIGIEKIRQTALRWGFGISTHTGLAGEKSGLIPNPEWKMRATGHRWSRGETMIAGIGQGAVSTTPVQLARFVATIANGGHILRPALLLDAPTVIEETLDINPDHLQTIRQAMRRVVENKKGTAYYALRQAKWPIAGKTGTAQVIANPEEGESPTDEKFQDHAWFVGYAPFDNPRIAFAVFVEHGGHGSSAAAPIAREIVNYLANQSE